MEEDWMTRCKGQHVQCEDLGMFWWCGLHWMLSATAWSIRVCRGTWLMTAMVFGPWSKARWVWKCVECCLHAWKMEFRVCAHGICTVLLSRKWEFAHSFEDRAWSYCVPRHHWGGPEGHHAETRHRLDQQLQQTWKMRFFFCVCHVLGHYLYRLVVSQPTSFLRLTFNVLPIFGTYLEELLSSCNRLQYIYMRRQWCTGKSGTEGGGYPRQLGGLPRSFAPSTIPEQFSSLCHVFIAFKDLNEGEPCSLQSQYDL